MQDSLLDCVWWITFVSFCFDFGNALDDAQYRRVYAQWRATVLESTSATITTKGMTKEFKCTGFEQTVVFLNSIIFAGHRIVWKFNGEILEDNYDGRARISNDGEYASARLQISNTRYVDTGVYGCYLTRYSKTGADYNILGAFQLSVRPTKKMSLPSGALYNAFCNFDVMMDAYEYTHGTPEDAVVQWRQDGKIRQTGRVTAKSPLRHQPIRASWRTAGLWQCGVKLTTSNETEDSKVGFYVVSEFHLAVRTRESFLRTLPNKDLLYLALPFFEGSLYLCLCFYIFLTVALFHKVLNRAVYDPKEIEDNILDQMIAEHIGIDMDDVALPP